LFSKTDAGVMTTHNTFAPITLNPGVGEEPKRLRRLLRWFVAGVTLLVVLAVGGVFVYVHFIASAAAKLSLPRIQAGSGPTVAISGGPSGESAFDGAWNAGSGSVAGYRIQEAIIGQDATVTGRTHEVSGSITISRDSVTKGFFAVNMASLATDQSKRNVIDPGAYPTATFALTSPSQLGGMRAAGVVQRFPATGNLTIHGVTKAVTVIVSAERTRTGMYMPADVPVAFADWHVSIPGMVLASGLQSRGTLEVLLHLTRSASTAGR
jgi:polyisoprenoid-binding protein YceI